ncbi:unnamed protein product [Periconia digitata]|uniref:Uncharacterized protein n=1 Tax=Periconia digitata TaxID=1303443 RepID=A0A9W4U8L6_9PLEO|nr:unnamed protein product [Periconia digitata]
MSTTSRTYNGFHHLNRIFTCARKSPIRVSLPPLPPQWLTIPQHRTLRLYPLLKLKNTVGAHPLLELHRYEPPKLEDTEQRINLYSDKKKLVAANITLAEAYSRVQPGHILYPLKLPPDQREMKNLDAMRQHNLPDTYNKYIMGEPKPGPPPKKKKGNGPPPPPDFNTHYQHQGFKTIPFGGKMMTDIWLVENQLSKAHRFLEARHPVEMQFRVPGVPLRTGTRAQKRYSVTPELNPDRLQDWRWLHSHLPYLHPDFILRGMPPGTSFWVTPHTTGSTLYMVFGPPGTTKFNGDEKLNETKSLLALKIRLGHQPNLPQRFRELLVEGGNTGYSTEPRQQLPITMIKGRLDSITHGMEQKSALDKRYMVSKSPKHSWVKQKVASYRN